ncbi:MAG: NUDIX hydrolase [Pseudomonadota bacterium]
MAEAKAADFDAAHQATWHPTIRPKPAASVVIIKHVDGVPHFLMGQRAKSLAFMPGYLVFPGGRLERLDRSGTRLHPDCAQRIGPLAHRLDACGARELTEETGLMLPDDMRIRYLARAITPPGHIRRYDTRFLACVVDASFGAPEAIQPQDDELDPIGWHAMRDLENAPIHRITGEVLREAMARLTFDPQLTGPTPDKVPCHRFRHGRAVIEPA